MDDEFDPPSKSQIKREHLAFQELGKRIISLPESQFNSLQLDEKLHHAIKEARSIKSNSALKRQRQFVGKIIGQLEEDEQSKIIHSLTEFDNHANQAKKYFHALENYRDSIMSKGDEEINRILSIYPQLERNHLRQLFRNAKKEQDKKLSSKHYRLLFSYLKENIEQINE